MKLWLDDLRSPPDDSWIWVKTSYIAMRYLCSCDISEISFDHDLGGEDTAMRVATLIEAYAHEKLCAPIKWHIHSANPVGRKNLKAALDSADRYWNE